MLIVRIIIWYIVLLLMSTNYNVGITLYSTKDLLPRSTLFMLVPSSSYTPSFFKAMAVPASPDEFYEQFENYSQSEDFAIGEPRAFVYTKSLQQENRISVDPRSSRKSLARNLSSRFPVASVITGSKISGQGLPPPLLPAQPRFLSSSLPNSATSSPRFKSSVLKKKEWRNQGKSHLQRSKSCGEQRACPPSDEFDLWLDKLNHSVNKDIQFSSLHETECNEDSHKQDARIDQEFKCGALCLYLPGFGKAKPVRARREEEAETENVISRTVSMEKFECGSWSSSAIANDMEENENSMNLYFDLPLELIRSSVNDANSPVAAAFVFDKDRKGVLKNGTTRAAARKSHESPRHVRFSKSTQILYPGSPSSCITPRLRKAREDFNAYLEAQNL